MTLAKTLIILLLSTSLLADDVKTITCFTISQARPVAVPVTQGLKAASAAVVRNGGKGIRFQAQGDTAARATWKIPLSFDMPIRYDISFSVETKNISSPGNRPNIFVTLTPVDTGKNLLPRKEAVFTAGGVAGKELGATRFTCPDGYRVDSIFVDLYLASDGKANLTIDTLEVAHQTNLPGVSELEMQLKKWRGAGAAVEKNGRGIAKFRIGKAEISCDGIDFGSNPQPALVKRLQSTGAFHLNHVKVSLGGDDSLWEMPGYFNASRLNAIVARAATPESILVLNVDLSHPPEWWRSATSPHLHSYFDVEWMNYCKDALKYMIAALVSGEQDDRVAGVIVTLSPHQNRQSLSGTLRDPGLNNHFKDWLKNRYFDNAELARTWTQADLTFETAQWVQPKRWPRGLLGPLGPKPTQAVRDSIRFYQESWDGYNLEINRYIKELTSGKCLAGIMLHPGRFKVLWDNTYYQPASLRSPLSSDAVDFVEIPFWEPDFLPATPFALEKPVIARLDISRITNPQSLSDMVRLAYSSAVGIDGFLFETNRLMSLTGKAFLKELTVLKLARARNALAGKKADVAFVIDPEFLESALPIPTVPVVMGRDRPTYPPRPGDQPSSLHYLYEQAQKLWPYSGLPYDIITVDELKPDMEYRVLVFFHCVHMTPSRIKRIDAMKKRGRTLIWSWADAVMTDNRFAVSSIKSVTGINIRLSPKPQRMFMVPTSALVSFLENQTLGSTPGGIVSPYEPHAAEEKTFSPSFEVNDGSVDVLATHIDTGRPAMATRKFFRWRSLYSCSPAINPEIIRAAALKSDAHVYYYHNDPFRLNDEFIVIHARSEGPRSLEFDDKTSLYEVFGNLEFKASKSHRFKVTKGKTYLFYRGSKPDWLKLSAK